MNSRVLSILNLNVLVHLKTRYLEIVNEIKNYDICILQEMKFPTNSLERENIIAQLETETDSKSYISETVRTNCTTILYKNNLANYIEETKEIYPEKILRLKICNDNYQYTICNIHGPHTDQTAETRNTFYKTLLDDAENNTNVILTGDWNFINEVEMSTTRPIQKNQLLIASRLEKLNFFKHWIDIHNLHQENDHLYTFRRGNYMEITLQ